jgi:DNA segregation ATPase FtsK/SpoIIIE-like protein
MANPKLPIQMGGNLPSLNSKHDEEIEEGQLQDEEVSELEDALGLEEDEAEGEIIELPDGSVVVNMEQTKGPQESPEFYANLAEEFDEGFLDQLAQDYLDYIDEDKEARKQRDKQYEEGLRRTGLGKDAPGGATFDGASKVVHPVMAEACVDFAASSSKELLPPEGIAKTNIKGAIDQMKLQIAERKVNFLNWQLTEQIPEYRDEMEQLLTQLPLGGSQFLKWRWDAEQRRPICEWIPIDNILLPYASTNFYTSQRATEVQDITEDTFLQRVEAGIYRDIDSTYTSDAPIDDQTQSEKANNKIEGKQYSGKNIDGLRRIYEITCYMRMDEDSETDGRRAPYILMIDESTSKVVGLYRNWADGDEKLEKLDWYVEFKFIPWRGAYAIGLPHLIGGLSAALTGALRALLDAAHISNSQTMLKLKGGRIGGQSDRIEPTQVVEIEGAPGVDDVRKLAMPLPFNQPSSVLYNLLGWLTDAAKGVVTTSEEKIGEANNNMPVGTTQALIEQGAKVFSSIHARLHRSQAKSLKIISRINNWYLQDMDNQSGEEIEVRDFAYNSDVRPVSDPNIFSETQRLAQNQALLQMATSAPPGMFDLRAVYSRIVQQLKIPEAEEILPNPQGAKESNPALENVSMTMGRHAAAYPDQDHIAHLQVHLEYAENPVYGGSPVIGPTFAPTALEHIKQHLMLFYLQSMRNVVAKASGGKDVLDLHEEKTLDWESQQALAVGSKIVDHESQQILQPYMQKVMALVQKVQQMQQAQQQTAMNADPTAQVLLKTQMAETQRKAQEFQTKMQTELQKAQQDYQLKVAELQQKVQELQTKYQTQTNIDNQRNATDIAMANINNSAKERVAFITAGAQMDQQQAQLEHEQNMSAIEAINASNEDIRQHGLAIEQQNFQQQADLVNQQAQQQAQQEAQANLASQQHIQQLQQNNQQHAQALEQNDQQAQQAAAQQEQQPEPQPPEGQ